MQGERDRRHKLIVICGEMIQVDSPATAEATVTANGPSSRLRIDEGVRRKLLGIFDAIRGPVTRETSQITKENVSDIIKGDPQYISEASKLVGFQIKPTDLKNRIIQAMNERAVRAPHEERNKKTFTEYESKQSELHRNISEFIKRMNKTSEASQHLMILPIIVGENIKEAKSCFADCLRIKSEAMLLANQGNDKIQLSFMKELKKIEELRDHILSTCNEERSWCYIPSATCRG